LRSTAGAAGSFGQNRVGAFPLVPIGFYKDFLQFLSEIHEILDQDPGDSKCTSLAPYPIRVCCKAGIVSFSNVFEGFWKHCSRRPPLPGQSSRDPSQRTAAPSFFIDIPMVSNGSSARGQLPASGRKVPVGPHAFAVKLESLVFPTFLKVFESTSPDAQPILDDAFRGRAVLH